MINFNQDSEELASYKLETLDDSDITMKLNLHSN